jgi:hypothetical protein
MTLDNMKIVTGTDWVEGVKESDIGRVDGEVIKACSECYLGPDTVIARIADSQKDKLVLN